MSDFDIARVEALARLKLSEEERKDFETSLPAILAYVGQLQEVDTSSVEANAYVTDAQNVMRSDEVKSLTEEQRKALIDAFPQEMGGALQVPHVFE